MSLYEGCYILYHEYWKHFDCDGWEGQIKIFSIGSVSWKNKIKIYFITLDVSAKLM